LRETTKASDTMNYFEVIPLELVKKILSHLPHEYFIMTLILINQTWYQIFIHNDNREEIMRTINYFGLKDIFGQISYKGPLFIVSDLFLFNRFIEDSLNFDILDSYKKDRVDSIHIKWIKTMFMIKFNDKEILMKQDIVEFSNEFTEIASIYGHLNILKYLQAHSIVLQSLNATLCTSLSSKVQHKISSIEV